MSANIQLPDFQSLKHKLNIESLKAALDDVNDSADTLIVQPLIKQYLKLEQQVKELLAQYMEKTSNNGHPLDDSEDYTPGKINIIKN